MCIRDSYELAHEALQWRKQGITDIVVCKKYSKVNPYCDAIFDPIIFVPNSFQPYSYDIQLLSLFSRQSLILSNVFHQLQRELFWGWANQAQNFFTTLLAITRLLDFEVTTLPYPTRS